MALGVRAQANHTSACQVESLRAIFAELKSIHADYSLEGDASDMHTGSISVNQSDHANDLHLLQFGFTKVAPS